MIFDPRYMIEWRSRLGDWRIYRSYILKRNAKRWIGKMVVQDRTAYEYRIIDLNSQEIILYVIRRDLKTYNR